MSERVEALPPGRRAPRSRAPRARVHLRRFACLALAGAFAALAVAACSSTEPSAGDVGSATDAGGGDVDGDLAASRPHVLTFVAGCRPELCPAPPVEPGFATCGKGGDGACTWLRRPATGSNGSDAAVAPAPCAEGACGAEPAAIACPAGYVVVPPSCTRAYEPACGWRLACESEPTGELCDASACGYPTFDQPMCTSPEGGVPAWRVCRKYLQGACVNQTLCPDGSSPPRYY